MRVRRGMISGPGGGFRCCFATLAAGTTASGADDVRATALIRKSNRNKKQAAKTRRYAGDQSERGGGRVEGGPWYRSRALICLGERVVGELGE